MKTLLFLSLFMGCIFASTAQVGINTTTPDASAILDITATDKGMLVPRMTEAQKLAIGTPATSLLIYQTNGTTPGFYYYNGTVWVNLSATGVQKIDDLTDGITTTNSLFLGENVGATETAGFRKNTSVGIISFQSITTGIENTALGYSALRLNTTGGQNTAVGISALSANQTGNQNVAVGRSSLFSNVSGSYNIAIGGNALYTNSSGGFNVAIGEESLNRNTSGARNTAVGYYSLYNNTIGSNNVAIGRNALSTNTFATNNVAVGVDALLSMAPVIALSKNTAVGSSSFRATTTGTSNTGLGYYSGYSNTTGTGNVAIGKETLLNNLTGSYNVAIGDEAGQGPLSTNVSNNIYIGRFSGRDYTGSNNLFFGGFSGDQGAGNRNIYIGENSGAYNIGSDNIFIGRDSGENVTGSNKLYIENSNADADNALIYGEFDTNILRANGVFQIGNPTGTGFALPTADGTSGQVMTTDGSGAVTFQTVAGDGDTQNTLDGAYDEGGTGAGRFITADNGAVLINGTDGFQNTGTFGSGATLGLTGAGTKMFFYPRKAAFRAGYVNGTQWNDANIGDYSTAFGINNTASGARSVAFGNNNSVIGEGSAAFGDTNNLDGYQSFAFGASNDLSGDNGVAFGEGNNASGFSNLLAGISNTSSGESSIAMGQGNDVAGDISMAFGNSNTVNSSNSVAIGTNLEAFSAYETVIGINSTNYSPVSTVAFNVNDRLFAIGNGTSTAARSNALTIYKDGRMNINDAYTMPTTAGSATQVLTTDGSGTASWQDASVPFELKDPKYPDGFSGMTPVLMENLLTTPYTIPAGKNLYITNVRSNGSISLRIEGTTVLNGEHNVGDRVPLTNPIVAGSGDTIDATNDALKISGFLVNANVTPISITYSGPIGSYTVPANKILVILNFSGIYSNNTIEIDSIIIYQGRGNTQSTSGLTSFHNPIFVDEGQVVRSTIPEGTINGYLIDK